MQQGRGSGQGCSDFIARASRALQLERVARRLKVATASAQSFTALDWGSCTRWQCGVGDSALLAAARADVCSNFIKTNGCSRLSSCKITMARAAARARASRAALDGVL